MSAVIPAKTSPYFPFIPVLSLPRRRLGPTRRKPLLESFRRDARLEAEICSSPSFPAFLLPPISHPAAIVLHRGWLIVLIPDGALEY